MSKILVFSLPPVDKNSNNTFELLFKDFVKQHNLTFLCCRDGAVNTSVFGEVYMISERMAFKSIINKKINPFRKVELDSMQHELNIYSKNRYFHNLKRLIRDFLWSLSKWKNSSFISFLENNKFDFILAPSEGYHYYLRILIYLCKITKAKLIFYTWDDNFSYKQGQISPLFYYYRMVTRLLLKNIAKKYLYKTISISEKTKHEADVFFKSQSVVIKKTMANTKIITQNAPNDVIKIVYAGNLLNGRDKELLKFASSMQTFKDNSIRLDVYSEVNNAKILKQLLKYRNVFIHKPVKHAELVTIESDSHIGLLIESLKPNKRKISRLSISTKFSDYIGSELPIFAIADKDSATINEIQNNNLGAFATNANDFGDQLLKLIDSNNYQKFKRSVIEYKANSAKSQTQLLMNLFQ